MVHMCTTTSYFSDKKLVENYFVFFRWIICFMGNFNKFKTGNSVFLLPGFAHGFKLESL